MPMDPTVDADAAAISAAATIAAETDASTHDVAVVLGSGWAPAAEAFGAPIASVPVSYTHLTLPTIYSV